jgi:hypothetical protein
MKKGTGKNHIKSGDMMRAPPNPLRRRTNPPRVAENKRILAVIQLNSIT